MKHIGEHGEIQRRPMKGWLERTEGNRNADKKVATRWGPGLEEVSIFSSFTSDRLCSALPSKKVIGWADLTSAQADFLMLQQRRSFQARLCSSPLHYLTPPHIHALTALLCSSRFLNFKRVSHPCHPLASLRRSHLSCLRSESLSGSCYIHPKKSSVNLKREKASGYGGGGGGNLDTNLAFFSAPKSQITLSSFSVRRLSSFHF